ncbi:putative ribonuclease H-like domain-containing protein [Tanacetum coccineum]|uniref:Ribonuclease H-like domain-containing protein n=1 Tax=Tanacetum coccineum TaxID=301880 RepID=A0ABQ5IG11_9ASTR
MVESNARGIASVSYYKNVGYLSDLPYGKKVIGTKWVFKNKRDERSIIVKNKARLVAKGFRQEEGIDYDEVFTPVTRIEAIRLFLAFASYMGFTVYQMDVKSSFLYGTIEEEVYVHQPPGFVDPAHQNKGYKVIKDLYGLHQAPRAWYETLSSFLMENGFRRGTINKTLFIKKKKSDIMLVQVYVDYIIFGSTKKSMCTEFKDYMHKRFQISSMGEPTFFLGLQVKQQPNGIFISQDKYVADILKKFDFLSTRTATTPIESNKPLVKDEDGVDVDEYAVAATCCGQVLWIQNQMMDYGFNFMNTKIQIDNESTISVIKNHVAHSRTKHIEIRFHFIRDCYEKRLIEFWTTAKSRTVNNISYIDATVAGKPVTISEASIRSDLLFDDADGIDSLNNQAIFDNIQLMGPSPSIAIPDSNPEDFGRNHGGQSSNDISLSGNEDGLTLQKCCTEDKIGKEDFCEEKGVQKEYVSKQGRKSVKTSKGEPSVHKDPAFDDLDDDAMDYMETEDAQDEGRTSSVMLEEKESADKEVSTEAPVSTVKPNEGTDKRNEGTDKQDGGTDSTKVSTDRQGEGTADQNEGKNATQTAPTTTSTPTPTIFGDDETIAQVLITMSQNKQKEKEKGVEIRNAEDTERPRPTSTRSILTLRPLPKIDPKDKGKKRIEEEDESDTESEDITEAEKGKKKIFFFKIKQKIKGLLMMKRWPERFKWSGKLKRRRKGWMKKKLQRLHSLMNMISFRQDLMLTRYLLKSFKRKKERSILLSREPNFFMTPFCQRVLANDMKRSDDSFIAIGSAEDAKMIKEMNEQAADASKKRGTSLVVLDLKKTLILRDCAEALNENFLDYFRYCGMARACVLASETLSRNGVGLAQLALFGGGMYFELLVYIPEASALGFSEVEGPLLVLPVTWAFSLLQVQENFSVVPYRMQNLYLRKGLFELGAQQYRKKTMEQIIVIVIRTHSFCLVTLNITRALVPSLTLCQDHTFDLLSYLDDIFLACIEKAHFLSDIKQVILASSLASSKGQDEIGNIEKESPKIVIAISHRSVENTVSLDNFKYRLPPTASHTMNNLPPAHHLRQPPPPPPATSPPPTPSQQDTFHPSGPNTPQKKQGWRNSPELVLVGGNAFGYHLREISYMSHSGINASFGRVVAVLRVFLGMRARRLCANGVDLDIWFCGCRLSPMLSGVCLTLLMDYEILDKKYPIIEWRSEYLTTKPQYDETEEVEDVYLNVVIRSNRQRRYFSTLMAVLSILDRDDICAIYQLVMNRYQDETLEGFDKILYDDLIIMFNQSDSDEFWNAQQNWKIVSWKLHSSLGVHTIMTVKDYKELEELASPGSNSSWLSIHLVVYNEELAIPEQTATGKGISNPLMAGSLPKTTKPT